MTCRIFYTIVRIRSYTILVGIFKIANLILHADNTSYTINSFALNPEGSWISFTFMDPGLLHATLGIVALHRDILVGNKQSALSLRYKGQAIHAINGRLESSAEPVSDENLALVALMIKFEVSLSLRPAITGLI